MKKIAEGFIERKSNHLDSKDPATRARVQNNTMILLYRFLFLLYAEGKGLLDLNDPHYQHYYSFHHTTHAIADVQDGRVDHRYDTNRTALLNEIKDLFNLVNRGSVSLGISKEEMCYTPAYNGGLFDPEKHPDLEKWEIGDRYIADAIDLLSRSKLKDGHRDFVDYSTLEIRHLGSIYEGLLEYKLQIAESDLVVSDGNWMNLDAYNANRKQKKVFTDFDENNRVSAGHLYLATDKGERKSTGSYYTPDYIVNYIVKNTIGPVVEEKWKEAQEKDASYIDATLSINVLDPAMGSGHFLVGAVEFLSQKLLEAVQKDFEAGKIADTAPYTNEWARRDVVSHCIYGVDLNELAVELAKVGLWLTTISRDKPLSFLDHRLKLGNSLIGAKISDLAWYHEGEGTPESKTGQQAIVPPVFVKKILNKISEIEQISEENLDDIKKKERIFNELQNIPEYQKVMQIADLNTSFYFGNKIENPSNRLPSSYYYNLVGSMYNIDAQWGSRSNYAWFNKALVMGKEKSFFHWELEFPEIFFDAGKLRENPGWDAVIGNPPYVRQESLGQDFKNYMQNRFESYSGGADLYVYFIEQSHAILRQFGYFGMICSNKFIKANYGKKIREFIKHRTTILSIIDFGELPVFKEASAFPAIFILQNASPKEQTFNFVPIKRLNFTSLEDEIQKSKTILDSQALIGENWTLSSEEEVKILERMKNKGIKLKEYSNGEIYRGLITGLTKVFIIDEKTKNQMIEDDQKNENLIKPFIIGDDIRRYQPSISGKYVILIPKGWTNEHCPDAKDKWQWFKENFPAISRYLEPFAELAEKRLDKGDYWWELRACEYYPVFEKPKIIYPNICRESRFTFDDQKFYLNNACYFIPVEDMFLLGLLNSKLIWLYLKRTCTCLGDPDKGGRLQLFDIYLRETPIHRISFTTPADRRSSLVNQAKGMYQSFTQSNDPQPLLAFVDVRLAAKLEESDVVHDLLAFLAEQMMEMNKAKNVEIKAFLNFVENEIGGPVDALSNKTLIQNYYTNDFTKIVDVLMKNKSRIRQGYNPKSRTHHDTLKDWYDSSIGKLKPLLMKINATDALIDQIVYKLYALTEKEIKVVERT